MENFAQYMLEEKEINAKMEIQYYLSKKHHLFFDKSVVLKTELARLFLNYMEINVDKNLVLTACLLCNCKKNENPQALGTVQTYAKEGAEYLRNLGFNDKMCKMCEEVNRYSNSNPREKESDILELVDQYGGMIIDRKDRPGFEVGEALVILEHKNLKDLYNRYLESFITFINELDKLKIKQQSSVGAIKELANLCNQSKDVKEFIRKVEYHYRPQVDKLIEEYRNEIKKKMFSDIENPNRPLFSLETTRKIIGNLSLENKVIKNTNEE